MGDGEDEAEWVREAQPKSIPMVRSLIRLDGWLID